MKKTKKNKSILPPILICALGLAAILYLPFSDWQRTRTYQQELERYETLIVGDTQVDTREAMARARAYNERVAKTPEALTSEELLTDYYDTLSFSGTDVMAYIEIPRINAKLPIYHGTEEGTLGDGIGHLEGTSLPIGRPSTHSVLVGHRGLSTASLFTRLDEMKSGDLFVVTVLGEKLYYQVDQIVVVEPDEVEEIQIIEGNDYCTLLTCTPFGINTQRLLVRGERVDAPENPLEEVRGFSIPPLYLWVLLVMSAMMLLVLLRLYIYNSKKKRKKVK